MFDGWTKPKFYTKCKSAVRHTKTRLEPIKKKRHAVEKFLKTDISDLLKGSLDYNAYLRADMLWIEQNLTACYDLVEQFCACILSHLADMQKQGECPEECREAVASLVYAAARFADLPELRQLRSQFTEKYGNSLDSFANKEFIEKLKGNPPTKDMKLQLMHDIAHEFSIDWDSKALEQKLFTPPPPQQDQPKHCSLDDSDDKWHKNKDDTFPRRDKQEVSNKLQDTSGAREDDVTDDRFKLRVDEEEVVTADPRRDSTDQQTSSSSVGTVSEDEPDNRPFYYRFIRPPYTRPKATNTESNSVEPTKSSNNVDPKEKNSPEDGQVAEAKPKPKPRSVRRRKPQGHDSAGTTSDGKQAVDNNNQTDEDERMIDGLLLHYSTKKSPYEDGKAKEKEITRQISKGTGLSWRARAAKSPPISEPEKAKKAHARSSSLELGGHIHPNLPDCDELAARVAALKGI